MKKLVLFLSVVVLSVSCVKTHTCECKNKTTLTGGQVLDQTTSGAIEDKNFSDAKVACKQQETIIDGLNAVNPGVVSSVTNCNLK